MPLEIAIAVAIVAAAFLIAVPRANWSGQLALGIALLFGTAGGLMELASHVWKPLSHALETPTNRPIEAPSPGYLTSRECRSCHPEQYATWHDSYHRTMAQVASPTAVLAPFDDVQLAVHDKEYRLERRGDEFWVDQEEVLPGFPSAPRVQRPVVMTTGSHHFQVYWLPTEHSRKLEIFQWVWRIADQRWLPIDDIFLYPPDLRQLSKPQGRWNVQCSRCHAAEAQPRIIGDHVMDTQVAEFGIACESCHGPGEEHVRRMQRPWTRYASHLGIGAKPGIVNPRKLEPLRSAQVCGQCHSVFAVPPDDVASWRNAGFRYRPGEDLEANRIVAHSGGSSWPDGVIRTGGREYGGLLSTPCFAKGQPDRTLTCLTCHALHQAGDDQRPRAEWANDQLRPGADTNATCVRCHADRAEVAALEKHTQHPANSAASNCYNCHMPNTSYGLLKMTRNHRLDSPSVATTLATGRPNACNLCHLDRSLGWAADSLHERWGQPIPEMTDDQRHIAASVLLLLSGDANQRAIAAWHMGWGPALAASGDEWEAPYLAQLLVDPYSAPRYVAWRALQAHAEFRDLDFDYVADLASRDEVRLRVRDTWRAGVAAGGGRDAVLLDTDGRLREAEFARLLSGRDERRLSLEE
jgi:hypothetical protein